MEENTKKIIIAAVIVIAVSMVSLNLGFTGAVPRADKVTMLVAEQDGMTLVVKLYPRGGAGMPGKWVDMRTVGGTKHSDEQTKCDKYGTKIGSAECENFEIATFDIKGTTWKNRERVEFNIRGTDIKSQPLTIIK